MCVTSIDLAHIGDHVKLALVANPHGFHSMDRYATELSVHFPAAVSVEVVTIALRPGWRGRLIDKYLLYPLKVRRTCADRYLIASEGFAFLIPWVRRRRPWVVCLDMHTLIDPGSGRLTRSIYKLNLRLLSQAQGIIAISEHTRDDLLRFCPFLPPDRVAIVHPGMKAFWAEVAEGRELECFRDRNALVGKRFVLSVGSDVWYKNIPRVLEAFARLEGDPLLVRVGSLSPPHRQLADKLGISARIRMVPRIPDEELKLFYASAELLLFPSLHEGFGWPAVEAMASGCPVVTSVRASLPEVCAEACRYVDPLDPVDIAAGVQAVMDDREYRGELIRLGRVQAATFSWERAASEILCALER